MNRIVITLIAAAASIFGMWQALRFGAGRTLAQNGASRNDPAVTRRAVGWSPSDASTHTAHGQVLQRLTNYAEATVAFERAVQLRPRDYFPWMLLGVTRDLNGNQAGAVRALRQSVAAAPTYAKPRWMLGNLLLRTGTVDEAFQELRFAAASDERYLPHVIDLAWGMSGRDPARMMGLLQPQRSMHLPLAIFFAREKQRAPAIEQFRAASEDVGTAAPALTAEMLKAGFFAEAAEVWSRMHGTPVNRDSLLNRGFEEDIPIGQTGFGWQLSVTPAVTMSLDPAEHQSGARSLRIDFAGNSKSDATLISQPVLIKPNAKYLLRFQAHSQDLVSAAPPLVLITDAVTGKPIAQSTPLAVGAAWREILVEFSTGAGAEAISIVVTRQPCSNTPCPAVGTLWLDSFQLETR